VEVLRKVQSSSSLYGNSWDERRFVKSWRCKTKKPKNNQVSRKDHICVSRVMQACQNKEVQSYDTEETHVNVGNHNQF